jgi:hypothetical protein
MFCFRWNQAVKQTQVHGTNMVQAANKADTMKEHFEDSCARMQTARVKLIHLLKIIIM